MLTASFAVGQSAGRPWLPLSAIDKMSAMTLDPHDAWALIQRGTEAIYGEKQLKAKLAAGKPLRVKLGMDPTAPDIHLGHTVVLQKMRQFQDLGHKAVLIIGDYTARIGDPTGRDTTRPVLSEADISANAQTYLDQAGKILDTSPEKFELRRNSEWLEKLSFADVLRLTGHFTVQQMLHRENFKKRMAEEKEIAVSEFMYPLMQAYDSVVIESDVELGGTDQTFNNLRGRDLMGKHGQDPQAVIVMPILVGTDGTEKMSKSKGNAIAITAEPDDMFGKTMSIPDDLMRNYFELLTPLPTDRIGSLCNPSETHPREAKDVLARTIVEQFHDTKAANAASAEFLNRFREKQLPSDIKTMTLDPGVFTSTQVIVQAGFATSNSDAKRKITQGGVRFDGEKVMDFTKSFTIQSGDELVLQVGKKNACKIVGK